MILAIPAAAQAQDCLGKAGAGAFRLTVEVLGLRSTAGEVAVTVYPDDARRFLAPKGKLLRARVQAATPVTDACFWLPAGAYAVAIYHDANGNRDFDRNMVGMPAEGFGFSNDAPARFGLPAFEKVRFKFPGRDGEITVRMRYPDRNAGNP